MTAKAKELRLQTVTMWEGLREYFEQQALNPPTDLRLTKAVKDALATLAQTPVQHKFGSDTDPEVAAKPSLDDKLNVTYGSYCTSLNMAFQLVFMELMEIEGLAHQTLGMECSFYEGALNLFLDATIQDEAGNFDVNLELNRFIIKLAKDLNEDDDITNIVIVSSSERPGAYAVRMDTPSCAIDFLTSLMAGYGDEEMVCADAYIKTKLVTDKETTSTAFATVSPPAKHHFLAYLPAGIYVSANDVALLEMEAMGQDALPFSVLELKSLLVQAERRPDTELGLAPELAPYQRH